MQKMRSSMIAAMGKQLKQSVNVFHNLMLYLRGHTRHKENNQHTDVLASAWRKPSTNRQTRCAKS
jgi:hypothetical protein